jgi:hypothetical protein
MKIKNKGGKRNKKINLSLIAKRRLKGLKISWTDTIPNDHSKGGMGPVDYSHSNPVHQANTKKIISSMFNEIKTRMPVHWLIEFETVFDYGNGEDRHQSTLDFFGVIDDVGELLVDQLIADKKKGAEHAYRHVEFTMTCLDINPPKPTLEQELSKLLTI